MITDADRAMVGQTKFDDYVYIIDQQGKEICAVMGVSGLIKAEDFARGILGTCPRGYTVFIYNCLAGTHREVTSITSVRPVVGGGR